VPTRKLGLGTTRAVALRPTMSSLAAEERSVTWSRTMGVRIEVRGEKWVADRSGVLEAGKKRNEDEGPQRDIEERKRLWHSDFTGKKSLNEVKGEQMAMS